MIFIFLNYFLCCTAENSPIEKRASEKEGLDHCFWSVVGNFWSTSEHWVFGPFLIQYVLRKWSNQSKKPLSMTIEILTDFDWEEVSKIAISDSTQGFTDYPVRCSLSIWELRSFFLVRPRPWILGSMNDEYRRQVQTDLAALFNREVDCIDCKLVPVTVRSCKFEQFQGDEASSGKTNAIVEFRDQNRSII